MLQLQEALAVLRCEVSFATTQALSDYRETGTYTRPLLERVDLTLYHAEAKKLRARVRDETLRDQTASVDEAAFQAVAIQSPQDVLAHLTDLSGCYDAFNERVTAILNDL